MKSRTSFFDPAVFKKNLTRFAPAWGLYTLCLLLGLLLMCDDLGYWLPANLGECIQIMPLVNCGYALVVAQLLFGDLFNTRMCNALHALPIRRETWFSTNILSGLAFSLGPSLVMTLIALPLVCMSRVVDAWQLPLLWLLGTNLQFLFFFALAVLCVFCVGSRFAMALVYAIINLGANVVYWLVDTLYVPMLYGIQTQYDAFRPFFPLGRMMNQPYVSIQRETVTYGNRSTLGPGTFTMTEQWNYLWLYAGLAIVLLALALLLYRRRRLETAGDFIAVKPLEPVFLVLYSLVAATFFQMFDTLFFRNSGYFFLVIGLTVGFFTGKMLLERRVNVFRKKNWKSFGLLTLAVAASLVLTRLDPLGIETWILKAENVDRVILSLGYDYGYGNTSLALEDPEDIENILFVHEQALVDRIEEHRGGVEIACPADPDEVIYSSPVNITICYELKNGTKATRYYRIWPHEEEGQLVKKWFSSLYCVTGTDDLVGKQGSYTFLTVDSWAIPQEYLGQEDTRELLEAIEADCAEGNLAQDWHFHHGTISYTENYGVTSLYLELITGDFTADFQIYRDSENTLAWLEEHGVLDYLKTECYDEKYR